MKTSVVDGCAHSPPAPRRANWRWVLSSPGHAIALGLGSGLSPIAPGTAGTLLGWLSFTALNHWLSAQGWAVALGAGLLAGWWACTRCAQALGCDDPAAVVWDEILAFWLVLWVVTPASLSLQLAAFALFRFFDAVKPGPVGWADALFKGSGRDATDRRPGWAQGWGILFDDLVAALCTLIVLALWRAW